MTTSAAPVSQDRDLSTLSNYQDIRTDNIDLDWSIDWDKKTIGGTATLKLEAVKDVDEVVLDTSYLDIKDVTVDGKKAVSFKVFDVELTSRTGSLMTISRLWARLFTSSSLAL